MAEGWLRNLRIPMKRTRSPAPSTTFSQSVKLFCYTFFIHIVSIFLTLSILVPLPLLLDPFSSDLPPFVSYLFHCLIGCIIFDGCIETLALISAKRNLYRRLAGRNYRTFLETVKENKVILKIKNLTVEGLRPLVGLKRALSSGQLPSKSNRAQLGGQNRSGCRSTASHSQNERTRDQPEGHLPIEDLRPLVSLKCANAAKKLDETLAPISAKRNYRRPAKRNLYRRPAKRNYRTFLEYLRSLVGLKRADAAKELAEGNDRTFLETEAETGKENKENYVMLKMAAKRWKRKRNNPGRNINIIISDFMKGFPEKRRLMKKKTYGKHNRRRHGIHRWPFQRSATGSPYGGHIQSLLMEEIVRDALKRKCRTMTVNRKWKDVGKNLGAKRIRRKLVIHRNWATLKGYFLGDERPVDHSQNERRRDQPESRKGKIKNSIICIGALFLTLRIGAHAATLIYGWPKFDHLTTVISPCPSPFQQNWATLKWYHSQNGRTRDQPEDRNGKITNLLTIEDLRLLDGLKCADAAKQLRSMLTGRPLVIDPFSSLEFIIRPFAILLLPFEQVWAVPMGAEVMAFSDKTGVEMFTLGVHFLGIQGHPVYTEDILNYVIECLLNCFCIEYWTWAIISYKDKGHFPVMCLSLEGKLVSGLLLLLLWFGRCLPQPPLALLSSQLPFTSNITQLGGQDQSGSTTSDSQNQRTRDRPEGSKGKTKNLITIDDLRPLVHLKRADAAKELGVSLSTFKRHRNLLRLEQWPSLSPKEVIVPPDQNGEKNPSPMFITLSNNGQITTENEMAGQHLELNEHLQDSLEGPISQSIGNGSIAEVENQNTIHDSHHGHALSQAMPITPITTESSEFWRNALASVERHLMESQSVPTNPHMTPLLTERQDSTLVKLNATYGEDTIKLRLPPTSGITELKQVVSTQLELGLDSFKVKYKDEYGEWILITRDEEVTEHLQLTLSGNQVGKLWVVNTTDSCCNCECDKCGSLKGKRP